MANFDMNFVNQVFPTKPDKAKEEETAKVDDLLEVKRNRRALFQRERRKRRSLDQVLLDRKKDAERKRVRRSKRTTNEIERDRKHDAERKKLRRAARTPEEIRTDRKKDADRKRRKRAARTQNQIEEQKEADRQRKRLKRASRTPEQIQLDRERDAKRKRISRALKAAQRHADKQRQEGITDTAAATATAKVEQMPATEQSEPHDIANSVSAGDMTFRTEYVEAYTDQVMPDSSVIDSIVEISNNGEDHTTTMETVAEGDIAQDKTTTTEAAEVPKGQSKRKAPNQATAKKGNKKSIKT
ncbi:hypothetical protein TrispH2_010267 [Trichoplax sp. H2]|nr:hypothetical protein TrispH2_010267 [Trichoplax sp. H2]|eukprot:RDD37990.1 hypothetical protein TrispH2_010267 [Trichoplax sp. H2]